MFTSLLDSGNISLGPNWCSERKGSDERHLESAIQFVRQINQTLTEKEAYRRSNSLKRPQNVPSRRRTVRCRLFY